jgi:SAM-dependent methyltransferase/DNA-binding transcriptional ArsR family regulator
MNFHDHSLLELRDLAESVVTVAAAVEAGLFRALADGPASARELADRIGLDPRAVGITLPVLAELGLAEPDAGGDTADAGDAGDAARYRLTGRGRRELGDPASPDYLAGGLPLWLENLRAWTTLADPLRTGRPVSRAGTGDQEGAGDGVGDGAEDDASRREHIARFMAGMAAAPGERVSRLVDGVLARRPGAATLLDLGGGPGHIARLFVERGLDVVLVDRPEVEEFVRDEYALDRVAGLRTVGADLLEDPLPSGPFDVVLLSNILHMLSPDQCVALLAKARAVLAPGGVVAIADFVRGRSPRAARFALVMLLRTEGGNTYTFQEHEAWLARTGFHTPQLTDLDPERQLITAIAATEKEARSPDAEKEGRSPDAEKRAPQARRAEKPAAQPRAPNSESP